MESLKKDDPSSLYYIIEKLSQSINVYLLKLASCDLICIRKAWVSCRTAPSGAIRELKKERKHRNGSGSLWLLQVLRFTQIHCLSLGH